MLDELKLTKPQSQLFLSKAKATAFVGGFGSGKSQGLFTRMLATKIQFPYNDVGYFAPSYSLIRDIAYPRLEETLNTTTLDWTLNKSENVIKIKDHAKILFRTMDNPAKIVGFEIKDAFIDELDTLQYHNAKEAWEKILARTRQKIIGKISCGDRPQNQLFVGTTPEGRRFVWKMWEDLPPEGYRLIKASTRSNPHLPEDYIATLEASYPANLVRAYIDGEFVNLSGLTIYSEYDRILNDTDRTIRHNDVLHIGMDFNVMNMNAVIHVKDEEGNPHAVKEITKLKDTPAMIKELDKYDIRGHMIYLYPDATGKSRKTVDASKSDLQLLTDAGYTLRNPYANPPVKDRIITMNTQFHSADRKRKYRVNQRECPDYAAALERQVFLPNGQPEKDPDNNVDDCNDAAGYFIYDQYHVDRPKFSSMHVASY